jgi:membrane fusion protein (multidrug efflux system)
LIPKNSNIYGALTLHRDLFISQFSPNITGVAVLHLFTIRRQTALAALLLAAPAYAEAPPSVIVTQVTQQNIAPAFSNIGHVVAIQSVKIVPRVNALINAVNFQQGSDVKTGQVLFTLQPQQYQAALQTAQANLASAQAALENAELVYARAADLRQSGFEAESSLDSASAIRNEDRSNVLSAEAGVTNAALNLSYCTITAPIDGRIGAVALTKGNLVTATTGTLATINQLDPIRVVFSVSADSPILTAAQDDPSESQFAISLDLPDGKPYPIKGRIAFLDNQVDSNTGTVNVYADFANPDGALLPGAYVNVATAAASAQQALLIPVAAVQTDQSSSFVLTVGPENKVAKQTVVLGEQIAQNYIVKSGITLGERVIVDGIQKVKIGQIVNPAVAPPDISSSDNSADTASQ